MGVEIEFRGVGLFVCDGGELEEVIFPNAERQPPWVGGTNPWEHPDRADAVQHHAGIVIRRAGSTSLRHYPIFGKPVMIGDASGNRPGVDQGVRDAFSRIDTLLAEPVDLSPASNDVAARIRVRAGGALHAHHPSRNRFMLDKHQTHLSLRVQLDASAVEITGAIGQPIAIAEGDTVVFYNYEDEFPTIEDLYKERKVPCPSTFTDHDFKWLYALLRNSITGARPEPPFPAPALDCATEPAAVREVDPAGLLAVSVSTCFPGLWGV